MTSPVTRFLQHCPPTSRDAVGKRGDPAVGPIDPRIEVIGGGDGGDIVAEGYDAGIRLGEMIEQDMITVPVSGNLRLVVVGSPAYFATHPPPEHPRELVHHPCINRKADPDALPYRGSPPRRGVISRSW